MNKITAFLSAMLVIMSISSLTVMAKVGSIDNECRDYFGNDFFGIAKFEASGSGFSLDEAMTNYALLGYNIEITGNLSEADWSSDIPVDGVLVKASTNTTIYNGGTSGDITGFGKHDISHVTFCGKPGSNPPCTGPDCGSNGVPEFPVFGVVLVVLIGGLGLAYMRRK
ncbi:MAG: hypothetical protein V1866_06700 [archaeon]